MLAALPQAAFAGGVSLLGGLLDNRAQKKAANDAFNYQATLNTAAFYQQQALNTDAYNRQINLNQQAFDQQRVHDEDAFHRQNHFFNRGVEAQRQLSADAYIQQQALLDTQNTEVRLLNDRVDAYNRDILANHSENKTTTDENYWSNSNTVGAIDFGRLVRDAEAAGFNPLTVLRAGAWAGFATSNTSTIGGSRVAVSQRLARDTMGYFAPSQAPQGPGVAQAQHVAWQGSQAQHPGYSNAGQAPSPGQSPQAQPTHAFSNAVNAGLQAFRAYDPYAAERQQLEFGLARAQIANLGSDTAMNNRRTFAVPTWTGVPGVRSAGGVRGAVDSSLGGVTTPTPGEVTVTNPWQFGNVAPVLNDAADVEQRYGEVLANAGGAINLVGDLLNNVPAAARWYGGHVSNAAQHLKNTYNDLVRSWTK